METSKTKWIYWSVIGVLVLLLILQHSCQGEGDTKITTTTKDVKITIPEVKGSFEKPTNTAELPSAGKDSVMVYDKLIYVESKVNEELKQKLAASENKYSVLLDAVRERDYVNNFSDKYVDIQAKSKIDGKLQDIKLFYTLKARDTVVQEKTILKETTVSSKFALFAGAHAQTNTSLGKIAPGVDLSAQINGKTIISAGVNTDKDITVGVKFRLFNINK